MSGPPFKLEDFRPGRRVELHPATDEWMMGDRYGTILSVEPAITRADGETLVWAKLDKSQRTVGLTPDNIVNVFD